MGDLIAGIGGLFGGGSSDKAVSKAALTGYNYLTSGQGSGANIGYMDQGNRANNAQAEVLGLYGSPEDQQRAFDTYKNSTGYNFMLDSGQHAITGSAAARGILNSGATAKALTKYGTDLASTYFQNYFNNLTQVAKQGQDALQMTAQAGTAGGGAAAGAMTSGNATQTGSGIGGLFGTIGNLFGAL